MYKLILLLILLLFNNKKSNKPKLYCWNKPNDIEVEPLLEDKKVLKSDMESDLLATITIDKINLKDKPLYKINSKENNINKNITILKDKGTKVIIAHSGIGEIAYFKNLYKLELNDLIKINKDNTNIYYKVTNIYEDDKDGTIDFYEDDNKLILTTCSYNKGKQLIIETEKVI